MPQSKFPVYLLGRTLGSAAQRNSELMAWNTLSLSKVFSEQVKVLSADNSWTCGTSVVIMLQNFLFNRVENGNSPQHQLPLRDTVVLDIYDTISVPES